MRRANAVLQIESEISKLKENHQIQVAQLKEQLEKNVRLIENVRQEKLAIQFEVTTLRKELSTAKSAFESREKEMEDATKSLQSQLADCEINYNNILKEKEDQLLRTQSILDNHKRVIFEMASCLEVKFEESGDMCAMVKFALENLQKEHHLLLVDSKSSQSELDNLKEELTNIKQSLNQYFPGIKDIANVVPLIEEKENALKVISKALIKFRNAKIC